MSDDEEFVQHLQSLGVPLSPEQRKLGLDRNTEEGALIAFAGSLRANNLRHRLVAFLLLFAFGLPVVLSLLWVAGQVVHWLWSQAS